MATSTLIHEVKLHHRTPKAALPFWRTYLQTLDNRQGTAQAPAECDIVIGGAGHPGANAAYGLLDNDNKALLSVVR